ncbi:MAG: tripartite tricarboxylate transporter substrate binding protein [Methylobacterium sp.]|nr:tripartite tricarboxylate transporter substrate binding protein [Methylobacterium sp.]MCA3673681.1 tripartite tricarboxylate transporter substrate binding protein [Methylobacterium sp.]
MSIDKGHGVQESSGNQYGNQILNDVLLLATNGLRNGYQAPLWHPGASFWRFPMPFRTFSCRMAPFLALALMAAPAVAETYPARPVTMIVPAPTGGGTDVFARVLAEIVETKLKQKFVVENRAGAGGTLGTTQVVTARPDGYTIGFIWNSPLTTSPHSLNVAYTPDSYRAVMSIGFSSYVLCAQPGFPAKDVKEMIAQLKEPGARFTYGNDGVGGTMQLAAERVFRELGIKLRGIPFAGAGETAKNFLGGHVDFYGGSIPPILEHEKAGKAKCLLLTSSGRNSALPAAAGLSEIGMQKAETVLWWGLIVPAGVPDDVHQTLEKAFIAAAASDKFRDTMAKQGATLRVLPGKATDALIRDELKALGEVAASLGIQRKAQ